MGFILGACESDYGCASPWTALAVAGGILGCIILFALFSVWFEG